MVRVHDVAAMRRYVSMADALNRGLDYHSMKTPDKLILADMTFHACHGVCRRKNDDGRNFG